MKFISSFPFLLGAPAKFHPSNSLNAPTPLRFIGSRLLCSYIQKGGGLMPGTG